jgi:hypothetical protein
MVADVHFLTSAMVLLPDSSVCVNVKSDFLGKHSEPELITCILLQTAVYDCHIASVTDVCRPLSLQIGRSPICAWSHLMPKANLKLPCFSLVINKENKSYSLRP